MKTKILWAACLALIACRPPFPAQYKGVESSPSIEELRKAGVTALLGLPQRDETHRLQLDERLSESLIEGGCVGAATMREKALSIFREGGFEEVQSSLVYPAYSLHLVRQKPAPSGGLDIVLFYFKIEKTVGVACRFTLGSYSRAETASQSLDTGAEQDRLFRNVVGLVDSIQSAIGKVKP